MPRSATLFVAGPVGRVPDRAAARGGVRGDTRRERLFRGVGDEGRQSVRHPGGNAAESLKAPASTSASVSCAVIHAPIMDTERSAVQEKASPDKEFYSARKENKPMSYTAEAIRAEMTDRVQQTVRYSPGDTVKARLRSAARILGLSVGRVADYVYGEVRRVEAHEADQIRAAHEQAKFQRLAHLEAEYKALRAELVAGAPKGLGWLVSPEIEASDPVAPSLDEGRR